MSEPFRPILTDKKALVVGIANDQSIAYGCARMFRQAGADLAVTWLNEKARRFVEPLAQELGASITGALDVVEPRQMEAVFDEIGRRWGPGSALSWTQREMRPAEVASALMIPASRPG